MVFFVTLSKRALSFQEYTNEIEKLRRDLMAMREKSGGIYLANENYEEMMATMEQQAQEISQKITEIRTLESELEKQIVRFIILLRMTSICVTTTFDLF